MSSGKKGGDQEVFDYLMSIDYGICYGPVDSFNQIYVKDKPIWCGTASERQDVEVFQPELFGGDGGEGGVVGVVEVYMGDYEQYASAQLCDRQGTTPATTPGYRGLAHLFFRGGEPAVISEENAALEFLFDQPPESILEYFFQNFFGGGVTRERGFRWATNNPYLPEMAVNLTRIPLTLSEENARIYPPAIDENGNLIDDPDGAIQVIPNLVSPPNQTNQIPVYVNYDFYIIADQAQAPYTRFSLANYSDDELLAAAAAGWVPTVKINVDYALVDDTNTVVPSTNHRMRIIEYDALGAETRRTDRQALASEQFVVQEELVLHEDTVEVAVVITSFPLGGETISFTNGPREMQLFFTEKFYDSFTYSTPFAENLGEDSHQASGAVFDLHEMGFTQQAIDDGLVTLRHVTLIAAQESGLGGGSGEAIAGSTKITAFSDDPRVTDVWSEIGTIPYEADTNPSSGTFTNYETDAPDPQGWTFDQSGTIRFRPGTRYVSIYTFAVRLSPVLSYWTMRDARATFSGPAKITGTAHCNVDKSLGILPDANPAHMIYECMTNKDWGKAEDPAMIDVPSFTAVAGVLHSEFFGLSMGFYQQDTIESFVQEVLDHIQAFFYQHPATGLWTLKLLRDDYDVGTALHIDESNSKLSNQKRIGWGETINEINVAYTEAQTEETATVTAHNLGNIAMNGGINSETREYYGIRNPILAQIVADRDVQASGYPVFSCVAEVDRSFWRTVPGDVVTLSDTDEGLDFAVMRVMGVDYGKPGDRKIKLNLSEDIFALEQTSYSSGQGSLLETDRIAAAPLDAEVVQTVPLPVMMRNGATIEEVDANDPVVAGALMADQTPRPLSVSVHTEVVKGNGDVVVESIANIPVSRSTLLLTALTKEAYSIIEGSIMRSIFVGNEDVGEIAMIGLEEADTELVMLDSYNDVTDEWTVIRGLWDTVPKDWIVGSRIWAFPTGFARADPGERASAEVRTYRFLPKTSYNSLPYADAADVTKTFTDRPFAPFRPANCQLDGNGFGKADYLNADPMPTEIVATWENRNRGAEDQVAVAWNDGNQTPEVGQTTSLKFYDELGVFSHEITGLTGVSRAILFAEFAPLDQGSVEFVAVRDGVESLWNVRIEFDIREGGYGYTYGENYGGG